jgi:hypothetical protein
LANYCRFTEFPFPVHPGLKATDEAHEKAHDEAHEKAHEKAQVILNPTERQPQTVVPQAWPMK